MNEAEWVQGTRPNDLINCLVVLYEKRKPPYPGGNRLRFRASCRRKLRLFACACCRRYWEFAEDDRSRAAVIAAEQYADGRASKAELAAARCNAPFEERASIAGYAQSRSCLAGMAMHEAVIESPFSAAYRTSDIIATLAYPESANARSELTTCWMDGQGWMCGLLRDIFGNPYQHPPLRPSAPSWDGSVVQELAQTIYDHRAFDRLPLLADALEAAGCTAAAVLAHCREPGPHVRGCWVVDLLLGKS